MNIKRYRPGTFIIVGMFLIPGPLSIYPQSLSGKSDSLVQVIETLPDSSKTDILLELTGELKYNDPDLAFEYGQQAIELATSINNPLQMGKAYMAVAEIYILWSLYDKALDYLLLSLDQFEAIERKQEIALCCNNMGLVYMSAGDYQNAYQYYKRAWDLNQELRNHSQIVTNLLNLGSNYIHQDSIEKGLSYFAVSLMIADSLNMEDEKITLQNQIGLGWHQLGNYEDALENYYKVLELLAEAPNTYTRTTTLANIASSYFNLKDYLTALQYAKEAFDLPKANKFNHIAAITSKLLSDIHAKLSDYMSSYDYYVEYKNISDTILHAEIAEELRKIQARYELDKKEQEIEALRIENQQNVKSIQTRSIIIASFISLVAILVTMIYILIKLNKKYRELNMKLTAQGQELEVLNDQKDKFFSFVAHNLKNPFNTIMGFAELMQRVTDAKDPEKVRQYSTLIYNLSSQVQKVLSNLLEWSRLQRRTFEFKPETLELNSLIKDVLEMNNKEAARKDLYFDLLDHENVYTFADRTMMTIVMQNLISNAINFTQTSGKISIKCRKNGDRAEVSVIDNGVGISEEDIPKLFEFDILKTKIGSGEHKGAGLGLIICKEMLQRNGGDIYVKSAPGKGSEFTFTLPVVIKDSAEKDTSKSAADEVQKIMDELLDERNMPQSEAISDIRLNIAPRFTEVSKVLSIENLDLFARSVTETGEKHGIQLLTDFGSAVNNLISMHQIDQIIKLLPRFKEYLDILETKS